MYLVERKVDSRLTCNRINNDKITSLFVYVCIQRQVSNKQNIGMMINQIMFDFWVAVCYGIKNGFL
jgi:hypothetical protein